MKKQKQTRITSLFIAFALLISLGCTGIAQAGEGPVVQILDDSTGSDAVSFYINGEGNAVIVGVTPAENATAITFPSSVTANSLSYDVVAIGDESAGLSIFGSNEMNQNKTITSVTIPDSVTRIAPYAFLSCTALAGVTLSKKLVSIGTCAFFGCTSLESIELPVTVTSIEVSAFYGTGINAQDKVESDKDGYTFNGLLTVDGGDLAINPSAGPALYPRWTPNTYEVSFDSQGGAPVNEKNVVFDTTYGELPTTTRTGSTFVGWSTSPSGTVNVANNTVVTTPNNHTLYAIWQKEGLIVTYDLQDGVFESGSLTETVTTGGTYGSMPTASKAGYEFSGWYTGSGGSGMQIKQGDRVTATEDHTLYAKWVLAMYTVTFDEQGGSAVGISRLLTFSYPYASLPTTTRPGYSFDGWWTELNGSGTEVTENTNVTIPADHKLYAKWIPDAQTVNFDTQDGTLISGNEMKTVTYGTTYGTLPEAERATYIFGGWWTEPGGRGAKVTSATLVTITDTQTLYANWTRPKFTVTFDTQGGTMDFPPWSYTYGETYSIMRVPTYPGYTFNGWWTEANGGTEIGVFTIMSTPNDHTLYARWTANTYTVTFDTQGGGTAPTAQSRQFGSAFGPLPVLTRQNYIFEGWYTASGNSGTLVTAGTTVSTSWDHTLYAKWSGNTYTVTFDTQGGEAVTPVTQSKQFGSAYGDLPTPTRKNYIFKGWYTASDDSGTLVTAETTVSATSDHALYAKWTQGNITVTLDPQGGEVGRTTHYCNLGAQYGTLPVPTRFGYSFYGWCTVPGLGTTLVEATTTVAIPDAHTLYAHWVRNVYNVTFDAQYGALLHNESSTKYVFGGGTYGFLPFAERENYTFSGWWTEPGGRGTQVTSGTQVAITANQTLYAKWTLTVTPSLPYAPPLPPPSVPIIMPGSSGFGAYIDVPPATLPDAPATSLIVARVTPPDGSQRILPGNYNPATGRYSFLYDTLPEGIENSGVTMEQGAGSPSGISEDHWAYQDASRLLSQGILASGQVTPSETMTRGDLVEMLCRAVAFPLDPSGQSPFSDVSSDNTAILWAAEKGVINGFPDGTFRADAEISRQETFAIIARFLAAYKIALPNAGTENTTAGFMDASHVADWVRGDTETLIRYGLIRGIPTDSGSMIMPLKDFTQGEMIALIARMIGICY